MALHFERPPQLWIWPTASEGELVPDHPPTDISPDLVGALRFTEEPLTRVGIIDGRTWRGQLALCRVRWKMVRATPGRGAYTVGWLVAVVSLYGVHQLDGHWLGWVATFVGYGAGLAWVRRVRPHPSRE